jgi:response regulator RpfG family c-di-GMP phosphodiesterase
MKRVVLLVDDDADVLHILSRHLRDEPCQVYTARSGEEAVDLLKTRQIHVVVADERMPAMQGTELLEWIAVKYPEVVRIVLTGCATIENALRAINEGGVWRFLTKPCSQAVLAATVREALEHQVRLRESQSLLEKNRWEAAELARRRAELTIARRILDRDLHKPAEKMCGSLRALCEQYADVLDGTMHATIGELLEALGEVEQLLHAPAGPGGCPAGADADGPDPHGPATGE